MSQTTKKHEDRGMADSLLLVRAAADNSARLQRDQATGQGLERSGTN